MKYKVVSSLFSLPFAVFHASSRASTKFFGKRFKNLSRAAHLFALVLACVLAVGAAGEVDPSFNASVSGANSGAGRFIRQTDGKILFICSCSAMQGHALGGVGRFNPDFTIDTSFNPPDFFNYLGIGSGVFDIELQPDGKILVGGDIRGADGVVLPNRIWRLNPDGSIDQSFVSAQYAPNVGSTVNDIELQPDGKILIGGDFTVWGAPSTLRRLNADGSLDSSFQAAVQPRVNDIELQADGRILTVNYDLSRSSVNRYNANGTADASFQMLQTDIVGSPTINDIKYLPDGKILAWGSFNTVNGTPRPFLLRANSNGTIDTTFNQNNAGPNSTVLDLEVLPDGKIVIAGYFTSYNSTPRERIARVNSDGSLDLSFNAPSVVTSGALSSIFLMPDGKLIVGTAPSFPATADRFVRLNTDGSRDFSFSVLLNTGGRAYRLLIQPDGKILAAGQFVYANNVSRSAVARFNPDGSLDASFVPYFNNVSPSVTVMALQPDGKILIVATNIGFVRLNADGSRDTGFNYTGGVSIVNDVAALPDGKILVVGNPAAANLVGQRLNPDGSPDASFPVIRADFAARTIHLLPDGKFYIGGSFTQIPAEDIFRSKIARFNADGTLDSAFVPSGTTNNHVTDIDVQPDGRVVLIGDFTTFAGNANIKYMGRLNANGSLDASFGLPMNAPPYVVRVQTDGKILLGGPFATVGDQYRNGIARLNASGSVDLSFNPSANTAVWDIALQTDGKILIGGDFTKISKISRVKIARLLNNTTPTAKLFDYDGDGKADISVFRPSENKWYILKSSDGQVIQTIFAINGDVPTPADFDGDGKTDISIYRPSAGDWWSLSSQNGQQVFADWGQPGVIARPSDFDGDGKSDYIYYLPSNSTWYRFGSQVGASFVQFGIAGDKPITGDFDGDGKSDVAIFRPSTGDWWWKSSVDNSQRAIHWGISTDVPAPADYDGDGKTDFAVYRPSNGTWYIYNSSNNSSTILNFGLSEDKPVPADYDGDGKADIAVFRPSTGVWYLMRSSQGFAAVQFGISTDIPTPNAFVP